MRIKRYTIVIDKIIYFFQENTFGILFDLIGGKDQDLPQILVETFEQLVFKFRKCRFKQEILFLIGLLVESNYYQ